MAFDPDKYLAEKESPSSDFDPDAYLASKAPQDDVVEDEIAPEPEAQDLGFSDYAQGIGETALSMGTGLASTVGAGLAGAASEVATLGGAEGAEIVSDIQEAGTYQPRTEGGRAVIETLGDVAQFGIDVLNVPLSGLAGIASLVTGSSAEDATKLIEDVQTRGLSAVAGEKVLEETGSPLLATVADISPELAGSFFPLKSIAKRNVGLKQKIADDLKSIKAQPELSNQIKTVTDQVKSGEITPVQGSRRLKDMSTAVRDASGDSVSTELVKYADDLAKDGSSSIGMIDDLADDIGSVSANRDLAQYIVDGSGKAAKNPLAIKAIDQGYDSGVVSAVQGASPADRAAMTRMLQRMKKGKKNPVWGVDNRPSDVAGDAILDRFKYVKKVNAEAGEELGNIVKNLKGVEVDFTDPVNNFLRNLDDMDIGIKSDLTPDFTNSVIRDLSGPEKAIKDTISYMKRAGRGQMPSAQDMHKLKKYIDEQVTFGKAKEGLAGQTERVLKQLRADLNKSLGDQIPEYGAANKRYSQTIKAMEDLQDITGSKIDLMGEQGNRRVGRLTRRLMSNAQSRDNLAEALKSMDEVSAKYGGKFDTNAKVLALFADELDAVFKPAGRTTFESLIGRTIKRAGKEGIKSGVKGAFEKRADTFNEEAFQSMIELLDQP